MVKQSYSEVRLLSQSCYISPLFSHKRYNVAPIYEMLRKLQVYALWLLYHARSCADSEQLPLVQRLRSEDRAYFTAKGYCLPARLTAYAPTPLRKINKMGLFYIFFMLPRSGLWRYSEFTIKILSSPPLLKVTLCTVLPDAAERASRKQQRDHEQRSGKEADAKYARRE